MERLSMNPALLVTVSGLEKPADAAEKRVFRILLDFYSAKRQLIKAVLEHAPNRFAELHSEDAASPADWGRKSLAVAGSTLLILCIMAVVGMVGWLFATRIR
jgi:hypothetical protein